MKGFVSKINEKLIFLILTLFFFSSFLYFLITNTYSPYYSKSLLFFIIAAIVTIVLYVWPYLLKDAKKTKRLSSLKHLSLIKKRLKKRTKTIQQLFEYSLIAYLAILIIGEFIKIEIISDILLVVTIILGILAVIFPKKNKKEKKKTRSDTILTIVLGIVGAVIIFLKTQSLGLLSYVISAISGLLIIAIGYLMFNDEEEKEIKIKSWKKPVAYTASLLAILSLILYFIIGIDSFRIVFGTVYILFLPGFVISIAFFNKKEMGLIERIALSFALSIAIVPLIVFYLNFAGMRIDALSVSLTVLGIIIAGGIIYAFKNRKK